MNCSIPKWKNPVQPLVRQRRKVLADFDEPVCMYVTDDTTVYCKALWDEKSESFVKNREMIENLVTYSTAKH